jgi:uncharacterized cupin superfamily protein
MLTPKFIVAADGLKKVGSRYPAPYHEPCVDRVRVALGDQFDLSQFGVNLARLDPGVWSSQRHWHENEDEFIYILDGEVTLADDTGEHVLTAGMCAGFKANNGNGHCLKNLSAKPVFYLEIGSRLPNEVAHYSDIDMKVVKIAGQMKFVKKDGGDF